MSLIRPMMGEIIDLTDPQYLAMLRKFQPTTNFHMENSAFDCESLRIGTDVYKDEALLIQLPKPIAANQIQGFEFDLSGYECFHDTNPPFSTSVGSSHHIDLGFISSDVDVTTHTWNDYLAYSFTRTLTFLMSHSAPGSNLADFTTNYSFTGAAKPGFCGLQATTSSLQETLVKGIVIVCGVTASDEHEAFLTYDAACSEMKIYRGLI